MFETILVPTDGSDHANKAVDLAADLGDKFKARIVILHVLLRDATVSDLITLCKRLKGPVELTDKLAVVGDPSASSPTIYGPVPVRVPESLLEEVGYLITNNAMQLAKAKGAGNIEVHVRDGSPADLILTAAEHENADAIVMGSRGLGRISEMLMGSVSHKVNHLSKCTCITVK